MSCLLRPLVVADEPFLWEMLYQALHVPAGAVAPPPAVVRRPELARYVQGWGRAGDGGWLARDPATGRPVGAVWRRLLVGENQGYGHVSDDTPELSMAVLPGHRGLGTGTRLLSRLLAAEDCPALSLSVAAGNPARRLYRRFGFVVVKQAGASLTMLRTL